MAHPTPSAWHIFGAVLYRDIFVTGRELGSFLAQVVIQPLFILFIYGKLLRDLGYTGGSFGVVLLPGIVALNGFLGGLQNTALPLVMDFSYSREIEDRLLAPMSLRLVAAEKIVFGALRGILAAVVMVPIGLVLLPDVAWPVGALLPAFGFIALGAFTGAAIGMTVGTLVEARRISILFAVILTPLMFTGATQFPWPALSRLRWFQTICAVNPLTYVSEGTRALLTPNVPHISLWIDVPVVIAAATAFFLIGTAGFLRKAMD
ncbi:MAG: ABC transporter [Pseudonocardiales bacterium]|nr:MAG: ABC transporter [Pseudonocardiales bacterium]